jgi:hypothetical protein
MVCFRARSTAVNAGITAECTAGPNEVNNKLGEVMKDINVYPSQFGGWIYEVWIAARPVIVGWCHTKEAAEHEAVVA